MAEIVYINNSYLDEFKRYRPTPIPEARDATQF